MRGQVQPSAIRYTMPAYVAATNRISRRRAYSMLGSFALHGVLVLGCILLPPSLPVKQPVIQIIIDRPPPVVKPKPPQPPRARREEPRSGRESRLAAIDPTTMRVRTRDTPPGDELLFAKDAESYIPRLLSRERSFIGFEDASDSQFISALLEDGGTGTGWRLRPGPVYKNNYYLVLLKAVHYPLVQQAIAREPTLSGRPVFALFPEDFGQRLESEVWRRLRDQCGASAGRARVKLTTNEAGFEIEPVECLSSDVPLDDGRPE